MVPAAFPLLFQGIGALSQASSSFFGASAQRTQLEYAAKYAELNARIGEMAAQREIMRGHSETARLTLGAGQLKGRQRAALAASGARLDSGDAINLQEDVERLKDIDMNAILYNATLSAWGRRMQAGNDMAQATMLSGAAAAASPSGAAMASLVGSGGQLASMWYSLYSSGALDKKPPESGSGGMLGSGITPGAGGLGLKW